MRIHLVTYATPRFQIRQTLLGLSARLNHVADTVTAWNPKSLRQAGFATDLPEINLADRGSGFWAWKPYIILRKLNEVPDDDIVFYCDVGRRYPFKTLEMPVAPYLEWMRINGQSVMPGLHIPWEGPMSMWTKRAAFQAIGLDTQNAHQSPPIQASFSLWRAGDSSRSLCKQWLDLCSQAHLINDDPSPAPLLELPGYFEHRHDQSLLTLSCLKAGIHGIDIGRNTPDCDTRHPDEILQVMGHSRSNPTVLGRFAKGFATLIATAERLIRRRIKFGEDRPNAP
jgi:hypothetical protein